MKNFETLLIPCLKDNYAVILRDLASEMTLLVDAPESAPILAVLRAKNWHLTHILLTHHHSDHIAGVADLVSAYAPQVIGNKADAHRLSKLTLAIEAGKSFHLGKIEVQVFDTPGHTVGHIVYYLPAQKLLFAGDTLFAGGCGRLFEGPPAGMYAALMQLAALPDEVKLYCGHEYTLSNLKFAMTVEPQNIALRLRLLETEDKRSRHEPTLPSSLGVEKATNPYLRAKNAGEFAEIRAKKDRF